MSLSYKKTILACYVGYIVQAIINNFLPLLFVFFTTEYNIPLLVISVVATFNFALQIFFDSISYKIVKAIGYRKTTILSHLFCGLGLMILGFCPIFSTNTTYICIVLFIATFFMASGGGIIEVTISPLINALPLDNKEGAMSLLHAFFPIGHILMVIFSTLFFVFVGIEFWFYLAILLALVPLSNIITLSYCPIVLPEGDNSPSSLKKLFSSSAFILLFALMILSGASEMAISQFLSYFAEQGINVSKTIGDLIGVCSFAFFMMLSRILHSTILKNINIIKLCLTSSIILACCYILSVVIPVPIIALAFTSLCGFFVGILWPATYSIASRFFPLGGTIMFSMLALGGDIGCTIAPTIVGFVANFSSIKTGILLSAIFPILATVILVILLKKDKNKRSSS